VGLRVELSRGEKKAAVILAVAILAANWAYVILYVG